MKRDCMELPYADKHWQFLSFCLANDSLLFTRATVQETDKIGLTLQCYKEVLSRRINFDKSALSYSWNVPWSQWTLIQGRMQVKAVMSNENTWSYQLKFKSQRNVCFRCFVIEFWGSWRGGKRSFIGGGKRSSNQSHCAMSYSFTSHEPMLGLGVVIARFW